MTRAEVLRDLVVNGRGYRPGRLYALAAEFDLLVSDVFVVAGWPVPPELLPPERDPRVLREFAYRVTFCPHPALAALTGFVRSLAPPDPPPTAAPEEPGDGPPAGEDRFPGILDGLMRNRGFGIWDLPFAGMSRSTINGLLIGRWHSLPQVRSIAGPLGWRFEDLAAVAGEPVGTWDAGLVLCRHVGEVCAAAVPLTTEQLVRAALEADRLSRREDHGAWRPVAESDFDDCPDR